VDLGYDPVLAFVAVTLPLILPAIAAGWMLASRCRSTIS
jgi:putrescine transport system permease protein